MRIDLRNSHRLRQNADQLFLIRQAYFKRNYNSVKQKIILSQGEYAQEAQNVPDYFNSAPAGDGFGIAESILRELPDELMKEEEEEEELISQEKL